MSLRPPEPAPGQAATLVARTAARAAEQGLADVAYTILDSPVGRLVAVATARGLAFRGDGA